MPSDLGPLADLGHGMPLKEVGNGGVGLKFGGIVGEQMQAV
jgi:hypothetical protein